MARIHQNVHYNDTKAELVEYKDFRRGGFEDEFWDEDELVDHRPSSKAKKKYSRGCKGNENKEHVYVWVPWSWNSISRMQWEELRCCGCEKRKHGKNTFRRVN